jgi:hypothetical protein
MLPYADAMSNVGSCSNLNDTERAIKHFSAAASCRRRAMFSSEPAASLACGRNVTLSNCPAPSPCSISTPGGVVAGHRHVGVPRLLACARDQRAGQNGHSRLVRPGVPRRCGAMESGGAAHRRAFRLSSTLVPASLRRRRYRGRSIQSWTAGTL